LVVWVGGGNWGVGFASGPAVGWFPLGWREPYYPAYRVSRRYVTNINVTNTRIVNVTTIVNNYHTRNVTNVTYVNRNVPGAVIAVNRDAIIHARPVHRNIIRIDQAHIREARVMHYPDAAPDRTSVLGIHAGERSAVPSRTVIRPVVRQITPPPVRHVTVLEREDTRRAPGIRNSDNPPVAPRGNSNMTPARTGPQVDTAPKAPKNAPTRANVENDQGRTSTKQRRERHPGAPGAQCAAACA
jgi:hypothetical protein